MGAGDLIWTREGLSWATGLFEGEAILSINQMGFRCLNDHLWPKRVARISVGGKQVRVCPTCGEPRRRVAA